MLDITVQCIMFNVCHDIPLVIVCFLIFVFPPLTVFFFSLVFFWLASDSRKVSAIDKATGTKRFNANTRPATSGKQPSVKGPYGKNPGCATNCGLRLPRNTEVTAARLIKHISCKFVKGLRLVVMRRKKKRSPPSKASASGRTQPTVISVVNDTHRSEAIEDCIQFINSSTSFTRSSSVSGHTS